MGAVVLAAALLVSPVTDPAASAAVIPAQSTHVTPPAPTASPSDPAQRGYQPSAYTGRKYRASQEPLRRCIGQREGRFFYGGTGSNGYYESTYQMTDALVRGAAWMMRPELIDQFGRREGVRVFRVLLRTPGHLWSRYYMDAAFYTVLNARGELSGRSHWAGGRYAC